MRLGLLGAGAVGELHADAAVHVPGVEVAAVCSVSIDEAARVAAAHRARPFTDYQEMFDQGGLDAVIISTPHAMHTQMVLDAAAAGLQVLVEKPMATTAADCDVMIDACRTAGVALAVGHIQHFMPDKTTAYAAIQQGDIGEPLMVHDYRSTDYRPGTRPAWFFDKAIAGGGAMMNIGSHCIDRTSWLVDSLPARVETATTVSRFGVGVETDAAVQLRMHNGVTASISVVSTAPRRFNELTVVGEKGVVVSDSSQGTYLRAGDGDEVLHQHSPEDIPAAFRSQLAAFVALVESGTPFPVSTELSKAVVGTVEAIYAAADTGAPVQVGAGADLRV